MVPPEEPSVDQQDEASHLALPLPIVSVILKDEDGNESPGGLLPRDVLNRSLSFTVPAWDFSTDPIFKEDVVLVGWRPVGLPFVQVDEVGFPIPIVPGDKIVSVPQRFLVHGVYDLSYILRIGGNTAESEKKTITVDRVAPDDNQRPARLELLDLVGNITDDYLSEHGQVRFKVRLYIDIKARDRAIYYWTDSITPPDFETEIREQAFSQADIDGDQLIITVYEDDIRLRGHGQRYVYYCLRDWAGNRGPRSPLLPVFVDLTPAPSNLKPPRIPLSDRGLIDRQHARDGAVNQGAVTLEVDAYDNSLSGDQILVDWDGTVLPPKDVDPANFPCVISGSWTALSAKGLGPLNARVTYRVRRGGVDGKSSLETQVPVNLTVAGQDHANAPALLNPTLASLAIYGANSKLLNTLLSEDFGEDADALLTLFDAPEPGQIIEVYWGAISTPVAQYIVQSGDGAGKTVPFVIPWSFIEQDRQNPALPVHYTTSNGFNQQQAPVTPVQVSIIFLENLKEPSFPDGGKFGVLDCCATPRLWDRVRVKIEGNPAFDEKDIVILYWQGCAGPNGTRPITGAADQFLTILNLDQARNGFEVHVTEFERLIAPMVNTGSALCHYSLRKFTGGQGVSKKDFVIINRTMPSGEVCSSTNETCAQQ
jgi:hypothetical protein